jgi:hypothetical protein
MTKSYFSIIGSGLLLDILKTILKVEFKTPYSNKIYQELILNTDEQKALATHFNLKL